MALLDHSHQYGRQIWSQRPEEGDEENILHN